MLKYYFIILFLIFTLIPASEARVYFDINAPTFVQIPIVLPKWKSVDKTPPSLSEKVYEILANDLILSGFFKVIDVHHLPPSLQGKEGIPNTPFLREWIPAGGEILLAGEALLDANGLNFKLKFHLVDLVEQKHIVGKQYEGPLQTLRSAIHRSADEVTLQITGEKGVHNTKIAYAVRQGGGKEIFIADFDGANVKQITQNQSINLSPVWSPDGKKIAFTSYPKRKGNEASPTWSPDGEWIAFVSDRSGSPQIYIMARDGSNVRRLTFEGNYNTNPTWSPKGNQIAFCGRAEGRFHIFSIGSNGSGLRRLTSNSGSNESPCC